MPSSLLALLCLSSTFSVPSAARRAHEQGVLLMRNGHALESVEGFLDAITLAPQYPQAWHDLGDALLSLGKNEEAKSAFDAALEIEPYREDSRYRLAFTLRLLKELKGAELNYRLFLEMSPDDPEALLGLAETLRLAGRHREAAVAYENYAKSEHRSGQGVWVGAARRLAGKLRKKATEKDIVASPLPWHRLSSRRPQSYTVGLADLQRGAYTAALDQLQQAVNDAPNDPFVLAGAASAFLGLHEGGQAETLFRSALKKAPASLVPGLQLGLAESLSLQNKTAEASLRYRSARENPNAGEQVKGIAQSRLARIEQRSSAKRLGQ